jgi:hypothetical protein
MTHNFKPPGLYETNLCHVCYKVKLSVSYPVHAIKLNFTKQTHNLKHHTGYGSKMSPTNYGSLNSFFTLLQSSLTCEY